MASGAGAPAPAPRHPCSLSHPPKAQPGRNNFGGALGAKRTYVEGVKMSHFLVMFEEEVRLQH